jgi:hypothetical protein
MAALSACDAGGRGRATGPVVVVSGAIPASHRAYVGEWEAAGVRLVIEADGSVRYERRDENSASSFIGSVARFEGDDVVVLQVFVVPTTFRVTRPPHRDGARWKMTVDGRELLRVR